MQTQGSEHGYSCSPISQRCLCIRDLCDRLACFHKAGSDCDELFRLLTRASSSWISFPRPVLAPGKPCNVVGEEEITAHTTCVIAETIEFCLLQLCGNVYKYTAVFSKSDTSVALNLSTFGKYFREIRAQNQPKPESPLYTYVKA